MDEIIKGMLKRLNLSEDDYDISVDNKISGINDDYFTLEYRDGRVVIKGNCIISACNGLQFMLTATSTEFGKLKSSKSKIACQNILAGDLSYLFNFI